jgi:hypothetical protein
MKVHCMIVQTDPAIEKCVMQVALWVSRKYDIHFFPHLGKSRDGRIELSRGERG